MLNIIKSHYKRFSRFTLVGILNTAIDFTVFSILLYWLGVYYLIAHFLAFLVANANSFIFNALWTFKNLKKDQLARQIVRFFTISLMGLALSTIVLKITSDWFITNLPQVTYPYICGKVIATVVSMIWNYCGSWLFVFNEGKEEGEEEGREEGGDS